MVTSQKQLSPSSYPQNGGSQYCRTTATRQLALTAILLQDNQAYNKPSNQITFLELRTHRIILAHAGTTKIAQSHQSPCNLVL